MRKYLQARWISLHPSASISRSIETFELLWRLYSQPHRHHHTLHRTSHLLEALDLHFPGSPKTVELALWLHDSIFIAGKPHNELMSTQLAELLLTYLGHSPEDCRAVRAGILSTELHNPHTSVESIVCDLDLLSLALPAQVYDSNTRLMKAEYCAWPESKWATARLSFIDRLLARCEIFQAPTLQSLAEAAARSNLKRERAFYTEQA